MRKKKNRSRFLKAALLASCLTVLSTSPAYAYANENVIEENAAIEHPVVQEPVINRGDAFSVEGNAEVLDHITNDESKEFYTIRTENNQTFYMVIDHAQTSQNVYMLSTIDEADLQAFLPEEETEKEKPMISLPVLEEKEPEVTKAPLPIEEKEEKALPDTETMMLFGIGAVCVLLIALLLKGKGGKKQVDTSDENLEMEGSLHLMDDDGDEDYFDEDDFDDN